MLTRKTKQGQGAENVKPIPPVLHQRRAGPLRTTKRAESIVKPGPIKVGGATLKRTAAQSRAAFGDLTNANKENAQDKKPGLRAPLKAKGKQQLTAVVKEEPAKKSTLPVPFPAKFKNQAVLAPSNVSRIARPLAAKKVTKVKEEVRPTSSASDVSIESENGSTGVPEDRVEEDISFIEEKEVRQLVAFDEENYTDVFNVGIYAQDIFDYYKRREKMFEIRQYLGAAGCSITPNMRAILVDWLVEVQENFELNHETLYLAVKICDMYLSRVKTEKDSLQLVGATAAFIACKFDERCPPLIEDFTFVCDHAFDRETFIEMEMDVLRAIDFDLGIPISYRFLRRYAKVAQLSMQTLTLARYILELSLMKSEFIVERDSEIAAAALYIAMKMKEEGVWEGDVVTASGYNREDLTRMIRMLNHMLWAEPVRQLGAIRGKYSHEVFLEVAKIAPLPTEKLL